MKKLSYLSLVISIVALVISLSDIGNNEIPIASILVAVLGILVTFLVAWQIYNVFATKEEVSNFRKEFDALQAKITERINAGEKSLIERQNIGLLALRDTSFRNINALAACINLKANHGVGAALDFIIDNLDIKDDPGGFLHSLFYEAAEGWVSDIVAEFLRNDDRTLLSECIDTVPHDKFCRLYSLDFAAVGWSSARIADFKSWLEIIAAQHPAPHLPTKEEIQREDERNTDAQ